MTLDEIENLGKDAHPGPWIVVEDTEVMGPRAICEGCSGILELAYEEDAKFIAASRELIPKFLAVAKAAKNPSLRYDENHAVDAWRELEKALEALEH